MEEDFQIPPLSRDAAKRLAQLAIDCIQVAYPNKPGHIVNDSTETFDPKELHPAFYGCYDWHSSVHGHWMLVNLLKSFPALPQEETIRQMIAANLTKENILQEVAYFQQSNRKSFERTYGWAWLLKLHQELAEWEDAQAQQWMQNLEPLTDLLIERYKEFLPKLTYPIRIGLHANTAMGLSFAWDYSLSLEDDSLQALIRQVGQKFYLKDQDCPGNWEPGGTDFLSPCLEEANFMRRILPRKAFRRWLAAFLPELDQRKPQNLFTPAYVADRSDPLIVHLDGLNLSRAWCMLSIASALPDHSAEYKVLVSSAAQHLNATLPYVASGNYEGEHWLGSFAVYALAIGEELHGQTKLSLE